MKKKLILLTLLTLPINAATQDLSQKTLLEYQQKKDSAINSSRQFLSSALPEPIVDSVYVVGPGDQFKISLVGSIIDEEIKVAVDPEGKLLIPKFGILSTGKNLLSTRKDIVTLIKSKTKNIEVAIQLTKPKDMLIDISGPLLYAGTYQFEGVVRLTDIVLRACGNKSSLPKNGSFRNVKIIRSNKTIENYDLQDYLLNGKENSNPYLFSGDRVLVEERKNNVSISGSVARNQQCEWRDETILDLINFSGGVTTATDSTVKITRFKKDNSGMETFSLKYPSECNVKVFPEDNLVIGTNPKWRNGITVSIFGRIKNPGIYTISKTTKVKDFIEFAGGLLEDAEQLTVNLQRPIFNENLGYIVFDKTTPLIDSQSIITQSINHGLLFSDSSLLLKDGDIITIPQKTDLVSVIGKVERPGLIEYVNGEVWQYYIKQAGGLDSYAYLKYGKVYKRKNSGWVSLEKVQKIEPGDIIMIPEEPKEYQWEKFKDIIAISSGIITITTTILYLSLNLIN